VRVTFEVRQAPKRAQIAAWSLTLTVVPTPTVLDTPRLPPCMRAMRELIGGGVDEEDSVVEHGDGCEHRSTAHRRQEGRLSAGRDLLDYLAGPPV
jgi:hypothetical protein